MTDDIYIYYLMKTWRTIDPSSAAPLTFRAWGTFLRGGYNERTRHVEPRGRSPSHMEAAWGERKRFTNAHDDQS
jgi:hypothetical protein